MAVHVHPLADERPHLLDTTGAGCWCEPLVEWLDPDTGVPWPNSPPRVIHNAADFRELAEGDGRSAEQGKEWKITLVEND